MSSKSIRSCQVLCKTGLPCSRSDWRLYTADAGDGVLREHGLDLGVVGLCPLHCNKLRQQGVELTSLKGFRGARSPNGTMPASRDEQRRMMDEFVAEGKCKRVAPAAVLVHEGVFVDAAPSRHFVLPKVRKY